jgi:hypothetical protein
MVLDKTSNIILHHPFIIIIAHNRSRRCLPLVASPFTSLSQCTFVMWKRKSASKQDLLGSLHRKTTTLLLVTIYIVPTNPRPSTSSVRIDLMWLSATVNVSCVPATTACILSCLLVRATTADVTGAVAVVSSESVMLTSRRCKNAATSEWPLHWAGHKAVSPSLFVTSISALESSSKNCVSFVGRRFDIGTATCG